MLPELLSALAVAVPTVGCDQHVEGNGTPEQRRAALAQSVRRHGTIFWGLRNAQREFDRRQDGWKAGFSVRYGRPMHVRVRLRDRPWLQLTYGIENREGVARLRFVPCAPDTPRFSDDGVVGHETGWAGGFIVKREGCATLLLRREGEEQWRRVRAGFGTRCR